MKIHVKIFGKKAGILSDEFGDRVYFQYLPEYLESGHNLSPFMMDFGAKAQFEKSRIFHGLFGVFADSLPDAWGNMLIDEYFRRLGKRPTEISPLERLCAVGDRTWGGITYEPVIDTMTASAEEVLNLAKQAESAKKVLSGDASKIIPELIESGSPIGGARPKRNIYLDPQDPGKIFNIHGGLPERSAWILKLEIAPSRQYGVIEKIYNEMALIAGIDVPQARLIEDSQGTRHFAVKRFDWSHNDELRMLHCHTLAGILNRDFDMGDTDYRDFFEATLRLTADNSQLSEAFRRSVFNVFYGVRDDHVKNHAFAMTPAGEWKLTPAYDVMFSRPNPGNMFYRQMTFGGRRKDISMGDICSMAGLVGIKPKAARNIVDRVLEAGQKWDDICAEFGLLPERKAEIESAWEIPKK